MKGERYTRATRTPRRIINVSVIIPSIEERRAGVLPQRYIDSMDLAKLQGEDGQGENGRIA
jgi:hypothetical protein